MSDTEPANDTPRIGRPPGAKNKAPRKRQYAAECADLQARINAALRILDKCDAEADKRLVEIAIATLKGE